MHRALELAARGLGWVEPNPAVGAVIVNDRLEVLGEGFHEQFGGPHAEVNALRQAGNRAAGATVYVTLEPCCHFGKTPPCTEALIRAGVRKVVVGLQDPAAHVNGGGLAQLRAAGIEVELGLLADEIHRLNTPFIKLATRGLPYVHAKWAMSLDGKIASRTGHSRWISNEASRAVVHRLRGRMDAILIGGNTARMDDPLLTVRPPGPRIPTRIVLSATANVARDSQLLRTIDQAPVIVVSSEDAPASDVKQLEAAGAEVLIVPAESRQSSAEAGHSGSERNLGVLLEELGRRSMTNVLIEGGSRVFGSFFDRNLIDEVHVFLAPKLVGGAMAPAPLGGRGMEQISSWNQIDPATVEVLDGDVYIRGPLRINPPDET